MSFATRARIFAVAAASTLALGASARIAAAADTVVQVDVSSVIDGRTVSTVANGTITPWTVPQGIDNDGKINGYVTNAVEAILQTQGKTENNKIGIALPNDGMFPADAGGRYPAIQLHFSDAAPVTSPQTHSIHSNTGSQTFTFPVPQATYSKMFLIITSSEGTGNLTVTLSYAGGAAAQTMMFNVPDYGVGGAPANNATYFNLISGMHKWSTTDVEGDVNTHTITGIQINPTPTATLTSIQVTKTNGSYMVFWGATGIATSAVATSGTAGSGGGTDAGATGGDASGGGAGSAGSASSSGSTGGTAGTNGSAGVAGTAGEPGAAGASGGGAGATVSGAAGSSTSGAAGATSSGAGGATGGRSSSGGGCSLAGTPARGSLAAVSLFVALGLALRRRRAR